MKKIVSMLIAAATLYSCGEQKSPEAEGVVINSGEPPDNFDLPIPQYGALVPIYGLVFFGPEVQDIRFCKDGKELCDQKSGLDWSRSPCWLEISPQASEDLKKLKFDLPLIGGDFWFKGDGRIAVRPGGFGHLNMFSCQVELRRVTNISPGYR